MAVSLRAIAPLRGQEAFRWTPSSGMQGLGDLDGGNFRSFGGPISGDGSTVGGQSSTTDSTGMTCDKPFYWTSGTGLQSLTTMIYSTEYSGYVTAISSDGTKMTGRVSLINGGSPFNGYAAYWSNGNMELLTPPDYPVNPSQFTSVQASDISADGSSVLVYLDDPGNRKNYLWNQTNGYTELISEHNGNVVALTNMAGNQNIYAGIQYRFDDMMNQINQGLMWSESTGVITFDMIEGMESSLPADISQDGSIVVGILTDMQNRNISEAFIWNRTDGIELLSDVLINNYGLADQLSGGTLKWATGISDDASTICGWGVNPDGYEEAWIATIPEPATILLTLSGALIALRKKKS